MPNYQYIQTFYINPDAVEKATTVMLTSVDLFFKTKPDLLDSISGSRDPGVQIAICEIENGVPNSQNVLRNSISRNGYDLINAFSKPVVATNFRFDDPVACRTGKYYGICVYFEDPLFSLWQNVQGQNLVNEDGTSSTPSPGSSIGNFDGVLYTSNKSGGVLSTFTPHSDRDLKFRVNVARFILPETGFDIEVTNKNYEFFTINSREGSFVGGELVYIDTYANGASSDAAGFVTFGPSSLQVVGTGTYFQDALPGQIMILTNGSSYDAVPISVIEDDTHLLLDRAPIFTAVANTFKVTPTGTVNYINYLNNKIYLSDSSATNAEFSFTANTKIKGLKSQAVANVYSVDAISVDSFKPRFKVGNPSLSSFAINYKAANTSGYIDATGQELVLDKINNISLYDASILSRSREVLLTTLYNNSTDPELYSRKSSVANIHFTTTVVGGSFQAPYVIGDQLDMYVYSNQINNEYLDPITGRDTEIEKNGLALCKHISTKSTFDMPAEDVIIYLTAFRPAGTEIRVYCKLKNGADNETFDDKKWTPLTITSNSEKFSDPTDPNSLVEYTYGLPQFPGIDQGLDGVFTTSLNSAIVTTSVDQTASIAAGDLIQIYDPFLPNNHEVFAVRSVDSPTQITLAKAVTNVNVIGAKAANKMKYPNIAFNNIANDNVCRYFSSSLVEFDGYNQMQIKIVLLSPYTYVAPEVEDVRVLGVSV